jgi:hypothetical protein
MCTLDPLGNAIAGLFVSAASQAIAQIDWSQVMTELIEGDKPKAVELKSPADLKVWLCQQCASGIIAPETLAQAITLLIQMETAQRQGNTAAATNSIVALKRILA